MMVLVHLSHQIYLWKNEKFAKIMEAESYPNSETYL
jgi:hypothetical protein